MSVSLCACLFINSSVTVKPNELKFCGMIPLVMQMVLGLKTSGYETKIKAYNTIVLILHECYLRIRIVGSI